MPAKKRTALPPTSTQRLKQRKQEKHWSAEESDWESQGDMEEEWDSLASDEGEAEAETEDTVAKPSQKRPSNATTSSDQPTINRRWDNTAAAAMGKTTLKKSRQGYRSWRKHKNAIITCLENCGGNISFTRRFMLFRNGIAIPRNVLHYYRHFYSPQKTIPFSSGGRGGN
ncbi:encapsidation protein 22 kDa [Simian adenovirus DM-2014]|uniref:Encapsidation protein 22 kDa n=1 Tax=Simian adenovirus DM-2014 TaxID=1560346 RepID=A0A097IWC9_9ADEN|nr:encapsidation protein 22 kDa [Simian adenovirus DM-2014]AIT70986.1 encapsidation protein 22 kDa [Simian adenovirus DM-2014]